MKKKRFSHRLFAPLLIVSTLLTFGSVSSLSAEELITMNFEDADIRILVKFISELTQKNFIIDDKIKGKVTIVSPEKVTADEAYSVFKSILEVKGFTLVPTGKVVKIVPSGEAKQRGIETVTGKTTIPMDRKDEFVTRITRLDYVNVDELAALIRPLISKEGHLVTYKQTNTMIVTDLKSNLHRILKIINELDVKGYHAELYVIPLRYASVNNVAEHLNNILEQSVSTAARQTRAVRRTTRRGQTQTAPSVSGVSSSAKIIPDERTNSLIVLATKSEYDTITTLVAKLDVEAPAGTGRINIYYLQNAVADEIVTVVNEFVTGIKADQQAGPQGAVRLPTETDIKIVADQSTNSLI
ncbi:MAG: secretin N-terminal domain-containing protein, partial [bacterium]|nr:secretin N-terminal domain-containing protein [bacterium]